MGGQVFFLKDIKSRGGGGFAVRFNIVLVTHRGQMSQVHNLASSVYIGNIKIN